MTSKLDFVSLYYSDRYWTTFTCQLSMDFSQRHLQTIRSGIDHLTYKLIPLYKYERGSWIPFWYCVVMFASIFAITNAIGTVNIPLKFGYNPSICLTEIGSRPEC